MDRDVFVILHSISKKMRKIADRELYRYGMTSTEMRLLNMIYYYDADGCMQDEFSDKIDVDRSNIGRGLKRLEKLGLIRRDRHEKDKRAFRVFLTDEGRAIKPELMAIRERIKMMFSMGIGSGEMKELARLLERAEMNLTNGGIKKESAI